MSRRSWLALVSGALREDLGAPVKYLPFFKTLLLVISSFSALVWFAVVIDRL
jgi:hypothetical protein